MMKIDCPFLEPLCRPQGGSTHGCSAGINFYLVGKDREFCRMCAVAMLGRLPDCQFLDAYAWLESHPDGSPFVEVELLCGLTSVLLPDPLPDLYRCARCPERLPKAAGLSRPAMAPALAG